MALSDKIKVGIGQLYFEKPSSKKTLPEWSAMLEESGRTIDGRASRTKKDERAQKTLRHISGIERWGQSRLRVLLGEPFVLDEYDGYCSGTDLTLEQQQEFFRETRQETVSIVQQLIDKDVPVTQRVDHNDFGPFTARGWLRYLHNHANIESKWF